MLRSVSLLGATTLCVFCTFVTGPASARGNQSTFTNFASSAVDYRSTPFHSAKDCSSLSSDPGSGVRVTSAQLMAASGNVPAHCRLNGVIPNEIGFQINLPVAWNGRLYMYGNGGYAGEDAESDPEKVSRNTALENGFATARTDTGHLASKEPLATFAVNPDKVVDHGYRAVHETIVLAKKLATSFYDSSPKFSYWDGCSTGGREGVMSAQRYPDDFDGIVAAAPTLQWTQVMIKGLWNQSALDDARLTTAKMGKVFQSVIAKCDAIDGKKDGLIDDPRQCRFDPKQDLPMCGAGADGDDCFTERQTEALTRIYGGPKDSSGSPLFVTQVVGSEDASTVAPFMVMPDNSSNALTVFARSWMKYLAFNDPDYDSKNFDLDRDPPRIGKPDQIFNPTDDLAAFKARGGKMITFWGWSDNALNPQMGLNYYERLRAKFGADETESFYRFFLVPGVAHCRGGYGPHEIDALTAVINWVEKASPPDRLPAKLTKDGAVKYNRSYCAYPRATRYKGSGSFEDPNNFTCEQP